MSTLPYYEPHKLSASILALVVHGVFFSLLYFGVNWHVKPPQGMVVEMWEHLPDPVPEIAPVPVQPLPVPPLPKIETPVPPKVVAPVAPVKADIELKDTKKKKAAPKPDQKTKQQELEKQRAQEALTKQRAQELQLELDKQRAAEERTAREDERIQEHKAKMRAEMDAATQGEVAKYKEMISAKISHNIVMPPDVPEKAEAKFEVIVLPGGTVADVKLKVSSGNSAYDSAAERAIYKSQPLPLPQDAALARMFRELRLSVKP